MVVFLQGTAAQNCDTHWRGGADFVVEVVSPADRTRDKIDFYGRIEVRELLIIDRQPWTLELFRLHQGRLESVGRSTLAGGEAVASSVIPLRLRLLPGKPRPQIELTHVDTGRQWTI